MQYNVSSVTLCIGAVIACVFAAGELNDDCLLVQDCRSFGYYCSGNRTCQCLPGEYIPNRYRNKCIGLVNRRCKYDEHCLDGGYCKEQKRCTCKEGLSANEDDIACSHSSRIGPSSGTITYSVIIVLFMMYYLKFCDRLNHNET